MTQPAKSSYAAVEVVMAYFQPDGQPWVIPVTGSLVDTKRVLNSGEALVSLDVDGGQPMAVNPAHVAAVQVRRPDPEPW